MNDKARCWVAAGAALVAAGGLILAGCEVDSASSQIHISPDSALVSNIYDTVTLTCVGGYECTWSLATDTWGTLNTRRGIQVIYTSLYQPPGDTPVVQVVTVTSKFTSMSRAVGSSTQAGATNPPITNIVVSATAHITHLSTGQASNVVTEITAGELSE